MSDSSRPEFWNERHAARRVPWDLGGVPAALPAGKVLIPGGGAVSAALAFRNPRRHRLEKHPNLRRMSQEIHPVGVIEIKSRISFRKIDLGQSLALLLRKVGQDLIIQPQLVRKPHEIVRPGQLPAE